MTETALCVVVRIIAQFDFVKAFLRYLSFRVASLCSRKSARFRLIIRKLLRYTQSTIYESNFRNISRISFDLALIDFH